RRHEPSGHPDTRQDDVWRIYFVCAAGVLMMAHAVGKGEYFDRGTLFSRLTMKFHARLSRFRCGGDGDSWKGSATKRQMRVMRTRRKNGASIISDENEGHGSRDAAKESFC
ncbi:unnamed protein product, partial [Hapterophycus canaliculatus]